ncbi:GNAT family N-acetyltransferase [Streptomyces klenkii]|uniref:GNAT family N-acetyltransferase n=1 Tax=Streptomyces klenkii TaxID=1420899 RepID=A0A3B0BU00_9ACTN|nr:GNAT family N-acetyltransferase [Streptomyces klenkii]RKN76310.1 GNAT family N-acetyltransferase [Streptomyces klenkii]
MNKSHDTVRLTRYAADDLPSVRQTLVATYAEVYADQLSNPFFSVERFEERLAGHASRPGWGAVVGYVEGRAVGYAYASPLPPGTRWWAGMLQPLPEADSEEDGKRTLALFELMVRRPWRGTGAAQRIHEELLSGRPEQRVTLLVDPAHAKVKALYERWGYRYIGDQRPFPDAPVYATMLRAL